MLVLPTGEYPTGRAGNVRRLSSTNAEGITRTQKAAGNWQWPRFVRLSLGISSFTMLAISQRQ
jgi:hypothetical protein